MYCYVLYRYVVELETLDLKLFTLQVERGKSMANCIRTVHTVFLIQQRQGHLAAHFRNRRLLWGESPRA